VPPSYHPVRRVGTYRAVGEPTPSNSEHAFHHLDWAISTGELFDYIHVHMIGCDGSYILCIGYLDS
jgi:hypothetical protein